MSYTLDQQAFNDYLSHLMDKFRVFAPIKVKGKGKHADTDVVTYGQITQAQDIIWTEKAYFSPKEIFYPIRETLFTFSQGQATVPDIDPKPMLIILRACDRNGIDRLDGIFLNNGDLKDFYYERRRQLVKFAVVECQSGFDTCFCVSMGSNIPSDYDLALRPTASGFVLDTTTTP